MLLPKLDLQEILRSRDRGNSYLSNSGSPPIRGLGSCLRLCRVVFACYTPTGGSRPTPAGVGQAGSICFCRNSNIDRTCHFIVCSSLLCLTPRSLSVYKRKIFLEAVIEKLVHTQVVFYNHQIPTTQNCLSPRCVRLPCHQFCEAPSSRPGHRSNFPQRF